MKKTSTLALVLFMFSLMIGSCTKYEDGPIMSFRSAKERVTNNWKIDFVFRNLFDVSEDFDVERSSVEFFADGTVNFRTYDSLDSLHIQEGLWFLTNKKEFLEVHYTEPIVDPDRLKMKITRLFENSLWVTYTLDDTSNYEIRYSPNTGTE